MRSLLRNVLAAVSCIVVCALISEASAADSPRENRVSAAAWPGYGRTTDEQHFSPLTQISGKNVRELGLAWSFDLHEPEQVESTPLVVDGVMYVTSAWSKVFALDARSGHLLWSFDPEVDRAWLINICCGAANRGVAYWKGKVFVGTLDGRLIALDARTGKVAWDVLTIDKSKPFSITGAPRVAKGKVIIGNGGADYGLRGYVDAYDAETGQRAWRFFIVPGNPAEGFENKAMEAAAKTWTGEWWKYGGGGTAWDAIVYDEQLDLIYIGTGNGGPWNQKVRSPGGGDNLYLASIVAVRPDTGEYVWHYQENPGETWDYSATSPIVLATLNIAGKNRKVLMQAPKNGFFYVIDRETGKLISAKPHSSVNWATHIDEKTGRPVEVPAARFPPGTGYLVQPGPSGASSWQTMSFDPKARIMYLRSSDSGFFYTDEVAFKFSANALNPGLAWGVEDALSLASIYPKEREPTRPPSLVAWDPVKQAEVWRVPGFRSRGSGALATAGKLVFYGPGDRNLVAFDSANGKPLWSFDTQNIPSAAPISYEIDGIQYVAVAVGWGFSNTLPGPIPHPSMLPDTNRVLVFALGGDKQLPPIDDRPEALRKPPTEQVSDGVAEAGRAPYAKYCRICHGAAARGTRTRPDLRYSEHLDDGSWNDIVLGGALQANGMISFKESLSSDVSEAIRQFVARESQRNASAALSSQPVQ